MESGATPSWLACVPALAAIDDSAWRKAVAAAVRMRVEPGTVLFRDGDAPRGFVLVLDGSIRVQKMDPEGHEIVLYRVESGQNCMLTTTCLLGGRSYPCEGIAEEQVELVLIPAEAFEQAMEGSRRFRALVMAGIGERISDLMMLIEQVAFGRMDRRIARLLLQRSAQGRREVRATHQELAVELGTAREVVSRVLKNLERRGALLLGRGSVRVRDAAMLTSLAHGEEGA
ncbi:MAG: Crp/Fnr family transcriptional regulator [Zetaproteobacteria bacterium]|nr:MAG: Crp/Fnr family transcriptional regulator [Zetaproteobacteria bacterium]